MISSSIRRPKLSDNPPDITSSRQYEARKAHAVRSILASRENETGRNAAKGSTSAGSRIVRALSSAARKTIKDAGGIIPLIAAGCAVLLVAVAIIDTVGIIAVSPLGIFLSGEDSGSGHTMQSMVRELNEEYQEKLAEIKDQNEYDILDLSGSSAVWREVLAVYAVLATTGSDPSDVASIDDTKAGKLRKVFWEMNTITSTIETITETKTVEVKDDDGYITAEEVEETSTILHITVSHKTAQDMAIFYAFDESQMLQLSELLSDENNSLWAAVIYGIYDGDEYLISSAAKSRVGNFNVEVYSKGPMIWPLDSSYHNITSSFGFRIHPINKTGHNHTGTDIWAPEGAKIYAVLPGTVKAAGEAGSYGNRVIIDHGDGVSTLYAHASKLLVSVGDTVEQGDTIALVGETGAATGPHLHIEVRINNVAQDAMNYLESP